LHKRSTEQRRAPPLTGVAEPKAAADFMLAACLPAMDSFANLEKIAQENRWSSLPIQPKNQFAATTTLQGRQGDA
jgi:hypothetical protein